MASSQKFATLEIQNPCAATRAQRGGALAEYDHHTLGIAALETRFADFVGQYDKSVAGWQRTLSGSLGPRELVVPGPSRTRTSPQTYSNGKNAPGFSVLHVDKKSDARGVVNAQINRATFFANVGAADYTTVGTIDVDRTRRLRPHEDP
ncbi:MAG: hypothetical protein KF850_08980 [Labilithrix sp.]|nr:hypothetical protein [Labilithrix sp.]